MHAHTSIHNTHTHTHTHAHTHAHTHTHTHTIKDDLTSSYEPILSVSAELIWAKLFIVGMKPLYICSYYRPPNSDLEPLLELKNFLCSLFNGKSVPPHLVLTGDFNLPDITWSETGGELASNPTYGFLLNNTFS